LRNPRFALDRLVDGQHVDRSSMKTISRTVASDAREIEHAFAIANPLDQGFEEINRVFRGTISRDRSAEMEPARANASPIMSPVWEVDSGSRA
jgi:hypothetical protein